MIERSTHDAAVARDVTAWEAAGLWTDAGRWKPAQNGQLEYYPTRREIRTKCRLLRRPADVPQRSPQARPARRRVLGPKHGRSIVDANL